MSKLTAVCAATFFVCTLALAYIGGSRPDATGTSVLQRAAGTAPAPANAASAAPTGASQIPTPSAPPASAANSVPTSVAPAATASGAAAIPTGK